ncbi:MAG: TIGR04141 family sporadically distributed protein [Candidatus Saccharibacteria bacterium]
MAKKTPVRVLLLKQAADYDDVIDHPSSLHSKPFTAQNSKLFWKSNPVKSPTWVTSIFPGETDLEAAIKASSVSGALIVKVSDRMFAITFGHGKSLIKHEYIEPRFGLKVVLNEVDPDSLRSIDTKSLDGFLSHTREQVPSLSPLSSFGVDIEKDFVRAVTGTSVNAGIGKTITGADAFASSLEITVTNAATTLQKLLTASSKDTYKTRFDFVDNISEASKALSATLDDKLVECIVAGETQNIWLAPPEIVDWEDHGGFSFTPRGKVHDDIGLKSYLAEKVPDIAALTIAKLRAHKLLHLNAELSYDKENWSIYKCLYAEIEDGTLRYILTDGKWFEVNKDYLLKVRTYLAQNLTEWNGPAFPDYDSSEMALFDDKQHRGETRYNDESFAGLGYSLMDQRMIAHGGGGSTIELCDMYKDNLYIHIKRYTRSSGLSHLFNQGKVSAELIRNDPEFRTKAIAKLQAEGISTNLSTTRPDMSQVQVVFGIISAAHGELKLPFFSEVALKNAVHFLKTTLDVGTVSLIKIQAVNDSD